VQDQIYAKRGDVLARVGEIQPSVASVLRVNLFWLGRKPLEQGKEYILKLGTDRVKVQLFDTLRVIDASNLNTDTMKKMVERHDVADCVLSTQRAVAFDRVDVQPTTSRFVIVDDHEIVGGGIIREAIKDTLTEDRDKAMELNRQWQIGNIPLSEKARRYSNKAHLLVISSHSGNKKDLLGKALERRLYDRQCQVFYLGYHPEEVGSDFGDSRRRKKNTAHQREELVHRMAEAARLVLLMGGIFILAANDLTRQELDVISLVVATKKITSCWLGNKELCDFAADIYMSEDVQVEDLVKKIEKELTNKDIFNS
jgi:bifunctional enzyme CysN/CysC